MAAASSLVSLLEGHVAGSTLAQEAQSAGGALLNILISVTLVGSIGQLFWRTCVPRAGCEDSSGWLVMQYVSWTICWQGSSIKKARITSALSSAIVDFEVLCHQICSRVPWCVHHSSRCKQQGSSG